ncbi:hypothetical protein SprV_0401534100 [Sparganum proliferum]
MQRRPPGHSGSPPLTNGCPYLLTCVDRFTRWPEAIPLQNIAAPTVVKAFLCRWFATFDAPSNIATDHGLQFESDFFLFLLSFLGCTRRRTTTYHIVANGMIERFHRQVKTSLRSTDDPENLTDHLLLILLDRTKEDLRRTVTVPQLNMSSALQLDILMR